ncbi:MAG: RsmE family RNA methyltransferase [Actinomycetes bacterium]
MKTPGPRSARTEWLSGVETRAAAVAQVFVEDLGSPAMSDDDRRHLLKVRRIRAGEMVVAADGRGSWRCCEIRSEELAPIGPVEFEEPPAHPFTVAIAPIKGDRSEWAVAKLTEVGCDRIVAISTERAAIRWSPESAQRALERWRRIAAEASCQARRVRPPAIEGLVPVASLLGDPSVVIGSLGGSPLRSDTSTIVIGPEGGWSEHELASAHGRVGLATQVLRTETAAVAAGVLLAARRAGTVSLVAGEGVSIDEHRGAAEKGEWQ